MRPEKKDDRDSHNLISPPLNQQTARFGVLTGSQNAKVIRRISKSRPVVLQKSVQEMQLESPSTLTAVGLATRDLSSDFELAWGKGPNAGTSRFSILALVSRPGLHGGDLDPPIRLLSCDYSRAVGRFCDERMGRCWEPSLRREPPQKRTGLSDFLPLPPSTLHRSLLFSLFTDADSTTGPCSPSLPLAAFAGFKKEWKRNSELFPSGLLPPRPTRLPPRSLASSHAPT